MYNKGNVAFGKPCTDNEYKIQFSLWCLLGAPLMIGSDIRSLTKESRELLLNPELIKINQDPECRPPFLGRKAPITISNPDPKPGESQWIQVPDMAYTFIKHVTNNEFIIAYYNFYDQESDINCIFADIGLPYTSGYGFSMQDVLTGEDLGVKTDYYTVRLDSHDCKLVRCKLVPTHA
jgi:alpha-galactosidase